MIIIMFYFFRLDFDESQKLKKQSFHLCNYLYLVHYLLSNYENYLLLVVGNLNLYLATLIFQF